jgi:hypothetical protein
MGTKVFGRGKNAQGWSVAVLALFALALPAAVHGDDRSLPPGAMPDGAYFRAALIESTAEMCAGAENARVLYKELSVGTTRTQFCQCINENFYAMFSDAELMREMEEARDMSERIDKLSASEKEKNRRSYERDKQRLAESETYCMNKLKVKVTPAPRYSK